MSPLVKTKRQANFKDFKRLEPLSGSSNKKTLYSSRSCVNWAFLEVVAHSCQKNPIYTRTRQINYYSFQLLKIFPEIF
jgi:hypothetical protein